MPQRITVPEDAIIKRQNNVICNEQSINKALIVWLTNHFVNSKSNNVVNYVTSAEQRTSFI